MRDRGRRIAPASAFWRPGLRFSAASSNAQAAIIARLIVVSGPSGAGKGTLISRILPRFHDLVLSVSTTTRALRAGEQEGVEYRYVEREEFLRRVEQGDFLEWAEYGGNLYGSPAGAVWDNVRQGSDVILEIELQGARQVMSRVPEAVVVFIAPPSLEELETRLRQRDTETEEAIRRRMDHARDEMDALARNAPGEEQEFDYVIVNDDVDAAVEDLHAAIEEIRATDTER